MFLQRDKETITYNKVVTALLINDMQQKLLMSMHHSSSQSTSSSITLTVSHGRTFTSKIDSENNKKKFRSRSSLEMIRTSSAGNMASLVTFNKLT